MTFVNSNDIIYKDNRDNAYHSNVDWLSNKDHRNWISYHKLQNLRDNLDMKIGILEIDKVTGIAKSQNKLDDYKELSERTKKTLVKSHINWISYHELNNLFDFIRIEMCILEIDKVIKAEHNEGFQDKLNNYKAIFEETKNKLESLIAVNNNLYHYCSKKRVKFNY
ncbi:13731_t:CDS:2 [Entrophospora sp. SA101]|nr:13731_t:CDS:2 [Entrophospora sp. SA101]